MILDNPSAGDLCLAVTPTGYTARARVLSTLPDRYMHRRDQISGLNYIRLDIIISSSDKACSILFILKVGSVDGEDPTF